MATKNRTNLLFILFIVAFLHTSQDTIAQICFPFIQNFSPKEYNAYLQNWDLIQDKNGLIYVANNYGVLEYDGDNWRLIKTDNEFPVSALLRTKNNKIFVGGFNEMGWLTHDTLGRLHYHSADAVLDTIGAVRQFIPKKDHIICIATNTTLKMSYSGEVTHFPRDKHIFFSNAFLYKDRIIGQSNKLGLYELIDNKTLELPLSQFFRSKKIRAILPFKDKLIIATRKNGVFLYDFSSVKQLLSKEDLKYASDNIISTGIQLSDLGYCFGTQKNGAFILRPGKDWKIKEKYIVESGLKDPHCIKVYQDNQDNIWLSLAHGISKIEYKTPLALFNEQHGISGKPNDIIRFNNELYLATSVGLYKMNPNFLEENTKKFIRFNNLNSPCWDLEIIDNKLFIATTYGLYSYSKESGITKMTNQPTLKIKNSTYHSGILYAIKDYEFTAYRIQNGHITQTQTSKVNAYFHSFIEADEQHVILASDSTLLKISLPFQSSNGKEKINSYSYTSFNKSIDNKFNSVSSIDGQFVLYNQKGIFKITSSDTNLTISPHDILPNTFFTNNKLKQIFTQDNYKNIWIYAPQRASSSYKNSFGFLQQSFDRAIWNNEIFNRLPNCEFTCVYPEKNGTIWIGTNEGLIKFDYKKRRTIPHLSFKSIIKKIILNGDSIILNGSKKITPQQVQLPSNTKSIEFHFSCTNHIDHENNLYQYKLTGFSNSWSKWSSINKKQFTNLSPGEYTFKVHSKNSINHIGSTTQFKFSIKKAWHQHWYIYILYFLLLLFFIIVFIRYQLKRLKKKNEQLEEIISLRTKEIKSKNSQLKKEVKNTQRSIHYAKFIQERILPSSSYVKSIFPNNLLIYSPRDIVSGDFYWVHEIDEHKIFILSDCTGHGVPGAFLAVLGNNLLNRIILHSNITEPDQILNELNKGLQNTFEKNMNTPQTSDGMELVVGIISPSGELSYANANSSIYVVRDKEIIPLNKDHTGIGAQTPLDYQFSHNTIQLHDNDMIYSFTDGFPDQFGGPKSKKFLTKRLKKLFIQVSLLNTKAQKETIIETFHQWKSHHEQTDDVTILGIHYSSKKT